jgi:hypothetical protein
VEKILDCASGLDRAPLIKSGGRVLHNLLEKPSRRALQWALQWALKAQAFSRLAIAYPTGCRYSTVPSYEM